MQRYYCRPEDKDQNGKFLADSSPVKEIQNVILEPFLQYCHMIVFKVVLLHFVVGNIVIFSLLGKFGCLVVIALTSQHCNMRLNPAWCNVLFQFVDCLLPYSVGFSH